MKKMVKINGKNNKETKEVGGLKLNGGRSREFYRLRKLNISWEKY